MVLVGIFSLLSRWKHRADERRAGRRRIVCRDCGHAWEHDGRERLLECPDCGVLNRKGRDQRLG
jgi:rubrerythrin